MGLGVKSEFLALGFGVLLVLVTFGDDHLGMAVGIALGNLDTMLGKTLWPIMDTIYPLATIAFFLLYRFEKQGNLRIDLKSALIFISFLLAMSLMNVDDFALVLNVRAQFPIAYWVTISLIYPLYGLFAFFLFGNRK